MVWLVSFLQQQTEKQKDKVEEIETRENARLKLYHGVGESSADEITLARVLQHDSMQITKCKSFFFDGARRGGQTRRRRVVLFSRQKTKKYVYHYGQQHKHNGLLPVFVANQTAPTLGQSSNSSIRAIKIQRSN